MHDMSNGTEPGGAVAIILEEMRSDFRAFGEGLKAANGKLDQVVADVTLLKDKFSDIQADTRILRAEVAVLKTDVSGLKDDMRGVKSEVRGVKEHLGLNGAAPKKPRTPRR